MTKFCKVAMLTAVASFSMTLAASAEKYALDPSHSQVVFSYNHLGYSTTTGMFSGFEGEIDFDTNAPEQSSVSVSIPVSSLFTGWEERDGHFKTADFFGVEDHDLVTFNSTSIELTGDDTAKISGTLSLNGVDKDVVLDTKLNGMGMHPMANQDWAGFTATTTLVRSEFDMGLYAPHVADEVNLTISVEAMKVE